MLPLARRWLCLSIEAGVKVLLWYHLVQNLFCCALSVAHVVLGHEATFGYATTTAWQVGTAAWCLAGVPFICMGLWSVYNHGEHLLRLYWYYMIASLLVDVLFLWDLLVFRDTCDHLYSAFEHVPLSGTAEAKQWEVQRAFACGIARGVNYAIFVVISLFVIYNIWVVWSLCEELAWGGSSEVISDLLYGRENKTRERQAKLGRLLSGKQALREYGSQGTIHVDGPTYGVFEAEVAQPVPAYVQYYGHQQPQKTTFATL
mmetsp:Transcript_56258/g.131792  ORF Transcript_56258/g.131792 Transcript_56258/m.131792 type:complete len:259 (-) Transcript_56258:71-847(-)